MTRLMLRTCGTLRISRYRCMGLSQTKPTRFSAAQFGNLEGCAMEEMQLITSGRLLQLTEMPCIPRQLLGA